MIHSARHTCDTSDILIHTSIEHMYWREKWQFAGREPEYFYLLFICVCFAMYRFFYYFHLLRFYLNKGCVHEDSEKKTNGEQLLCPNLVSLMSMTHLLLLVEWCMQIGLLATDGVPQLSLSSMMKRLTQSGCNQHVCLDMQTESVSDTGVSMKYQIFKTCLTLFWADISE